MVPAPPPTASSHRPLAALPHHGRWQVYHGPSDRAAACGAFRRRGGAAAAAATLRLTRLGPAALLRALTAEVEADVEREVLQVLASCA